jgi:hypothetical protein
MSYRNISKILPVRIMRLDHLRDPDVGRSTALHLSIKRWNLSVLTKFISLRTGLSGGFLCRPQWAFWFHKICNISQPAERQLAYQEKLCFVSFVYKYIIIRTQEKQRLKFIVSLKNVALYKI